MKNVRTAFEIAPWQLEVHVDSALDMPPDFPMPVTSGMGRGILDLVLWDK